MWLLFAVRLPISSVPFNSIHNYWCLSIYGWLSLEWQHKLQIDVTMEVHDCIQHVSSSQFYPCRLSKHSSDYNFLYFIHSAYHLSYKFPLNIYFTRCWETTGSYSCLLDNTVYFKYILMFSYYAVRIFLIYLTFPR